MNPHAQTMFAHSRAITDLMAHMGLTGDVTGGSVMAVDGVTHIEYRWQSPGADVPALEDAMDALHAQLPDVGLRREATDVVFTVPLQRAVAGNITRAKSAERRIAR